MTVPIARNTLIHGNPIIRLSRPSGPTESYCSDYETEDDQSQTGFSDISRRVLETMVSRPYPCGKFILRFLAVTVRDIRAMVTLTSA